MKIIMNYKMNYKDRDLVLENMSLDELKQANTKVICLETFSDHENDVIFEKNKIYTQLDIIIGLINSSDVNYNIDGDVDISNNRIDYDKYYMPLADYRDKRIDDILK